MAHVPGVWDQMRTCVTIPVYNEAQAIGGLVKKLREHKLDVVVVDDGSQDHSGKIAKEMGAVVLVHNERKGKGQSLRDGFAYAIENCYDGIIAMDGDGQHDVADVEQFLKKAQEHKDSIICGNRMHNPKGMPHIRLVVNRIMSLVISFVCKQKVEDSQCGFRYMGVRILKEIPLISSDFEIESEVLIEASKKGFKIFSVPISTIYRDEKSKINPLKDTIRFFKYILKEMCCSRK